MQREMFTPPGGTTFIPPEYIVYLSNEDDKEWQGEKRRGLEQGLYTVLSERARELAGQTQLATKSFAVELRVDGTLNKGEFRVQPVWDETESGHTMVTARSPELMKTSLPGGMTPEMVAQALEGGGGSSLPVTEAAESEATVVRPRVTELFNVEVWYKGVRQSVVPIIKQEI